MLEGIEGSSGIGYSKKESQQNAAKLTLEQLRKKPQFIDAVFAAKSNRTKMEEQPAMAVPNIDEHKNMIGTSDTIESSEKCEVKQSVREGKKAGKKVDIHDEFDLSDISAKEPSREEIIAMAEAEAYS